MGPPSSTVFLYPVVLIPLVFMVMGITWFVCSLGVYIRDVNQFVGLAVTMLMFLSPVFYPLASLTEQFRFYLYLNPLTYPIELSRDLLFWGRLPDLVPLLAYYVESILIASLGFAWFQKTRKGFADVL